MGWSKLEQSTPVKKIQDDNNLRKNTYSITTPSVVQDYTYVNKFNSTINHWVGTGLGLVYIPQIVYNM